MRRRFLTGLVLLSLSAGATACGSGAGSVDTTAVPSSDSTVALTKGKSSFWGEVSGVFNDAGGAIVGVVDDAGDALEGAYNDTMKAADDATKWADANSRTLASQVTGEYRNASGQIVDAANTVVTFLTTDWPDMTDAMVQQVKGWVQDGFNEVAKDIQSVTGRSVMDKYLGCMGYVPGKGGSASVVSLTQGDASPKATGPTAKCEEFGSGMQRAVNEFIMQVATDMPTIKQQVDLYLRVATLIVKAFLPAPLNYVPVATLTSDFRTEWWTKDEHKANINLTLDFFGLKKYTFGLACIAFATDGLTPAAFSLNGGCGNPWGLQAAYSDSMAFVKTAAKAFEKTARDVASCVKVDMSTVKKGTVSTNVLSFDPKCPEAVQNIGSDLLKYASKYQDPRKVPSMLMRSTLNSVLGKITGNAVYDPKAEVFAKFPFLVWLVPVAQLGSARMNQDSWSAKGEINLALGVTYAGISLVTSDIACVTMGTKWSDTPTVTTDGGCDRTWGLEVGGVTVYEDN